MLVFCAEIYQEAPKQAFLGTMIAALPRASRTLDERLMPRRWIRDEDDTSGFAQTCSDPSTQVTALPPSHIVP